MTLRFFSSILSPRVGVEDSKNDSLSDEYKLSTDKFTFIYSFDKLSKEYTRAQKKKKPIRRFSAF